MRIVQRYRRVNRERVRMRRNQQNASQFIGDALVAVEVLTGFDGKDILGQSRSSKVTYARHLFIWALAELGGIGATGIGHLVGRDHSSVITAHRRIVNQRSVMDDVRRDTDRLALTLRAA